MHNQFCAATRCGRRRIVASFRSREKKAPAPARGESKNRFEAGAAAQRRQSGGGPAGRIEKRPEPFGSGRTKSCPWFHLNSGQRPHSPPVTGASGRTFPPCCSETPSPPPSWRLAPSVPSLLFPACGYSSSSSLPLLSLYSITFSPSCQGKSDIFRFVRNK